MSAGPKRRNMACTYCRYRKRRCDGQIPMCKTCRERGLNCEYQDVPSPKHDIAEEHLRRLEIVEDTVRQHSIAIASSARHALDPLQHPSRAPTVISNREDMFRLNTRESQQQDASLEHSADAVSRAMDGQTSHANHEVPPLTIPLGHQTSLSSLLTLPQMRSLVGDYPEEFLFLVEESRPRSLSLQHILAPHAEADPDWRNIEKSVADDCLERYLSKVHIYRPIFEWEELRLQYETTMSEGLSDNPCSALFLAIFALGITASDPVDPTRVRCSGDELIKQALRMLFPSWAATFSGDLVLSQALVLCALYFCYVTDPLVAWRLVHMASTSVQQMRNEHSSQKTHESVIRVGWTCFLIECDILAEFHQPRSGVELLVDRMPFPTYRNATASETLYSLADISARSLSNRIHHTIYFTDGISLYVGRSQSSSGTLLANPDVSLLRVCEELDRQLITWYESLPTAIKPDLSGNSRGSGQACVLRLRYWSARHNIYRPFVIYVTSRAADLETSVPTAVLERCRLCLSACRIFILTAGYVLSERTPYNFSTAQCVVVYALILALAAQTRALADLVEDTVELLETAVGLLKPWAIPGSGIECGLEIISSVHKKQRLRSHRVE
ncbi:hypothetical protein, variant [Phialophora macrospora]|uniref:Zn(2)-C6 fungal-type domain-containing protein n=1 Tax=Phialophora macrospora TaxID=1851006 RepID=A0A0D2FAD3_9EURO|nr:hypothetical protein, variant [Phialophora macrospora]